jgi:NADH-quinone oxidoreductase subunit L
MNGPLLVVAVMAWLMAIPAVLGVSLLVMRPFSDTWLSRLATLHAVGVFGGMASLLVWFVAQPLSSVEITGPHIIELGTYELVPVLLLDRLSLTYAMLVAVVYPVIVRFSIPSFHREPGAARFWFLVTLFGAALCVLSLAGSIDVLYFGWELVGMSSVMLIAFFRSSARANDNSLRALVYYRIGDVFLLSAAVYIHVGFPNAHIAEFAADAAAPAAVGVAMSLLIASLAKAAQLPMSPWLHRAMEGPAASSGIFYGALSVHLGPFLLLRTAPLWLPHVEVRVVMFAIGALTALWASLVGRTRNDAKTALAYATMAQVGVLYMEISLGFTTLALVHLWAHAGLRTWQFLRSSSLIQDFQDNPMYGVGARSRTPPLLARLLPTSWHERLYLAASRQFFIDGAQLLAVRPVLALFAMLQRLEDRVLGGER